MKKIINFFKEVRAEFKHISWPKRESIIQSTIVVISISIIVSLILGGFDFIFTQAIGLIGSKPVTKVENILPTTAPNLPTINLAQPTIKK
ncbi:MAG: Preprotein translocase subunit SecE [Candidatus Shapirobacteria bacterium GW2011_GWE1_38_10]|uniref:Protein translocase subunit SecE n=1 Tax=Candidatus Shapirobacteria bacterium GW2011_GWE1_38_10 TaxID=1618488 RepID=A0A0G0KNS8_9BACT|nr:MAG: Preprotein translocase subunit SecE [Candidatus Shapirobacteria bacterium GW2011_GWF2_37_20]KKQ50839.1 MAG: Preprotein translocase subunit SecE [Candidatus Shapirobacteria bacterium GW2011_GWE1_38_10]KKQ64862.1 MAG: Preprotein translocase subunit SecE [Candidatus Shapirobacteria bacterium GW2011_GWF1_38_23]HBP51052.1 preprotein translocase subunit SecE [Candidatus Shapirobacteria bacterium]